MIQIRKIFISTAIFILIIINCANSNSIELENRDFIIAIGVDKNNEGSFQITTLSADMDYFQKKSPTSNKKYVHCASDANIKKALDKINQKLNKNMYLSHTQIIFINKRLLQNKKSSSNIAFELENITQLNQKVKIIPADSAKKIIQSKFSPDLLDYIKNKLDNHYLSINSLMKHID